MKIGVVGAGIAGLTCAYRLQCGGHEVTVYEREAQVGGRMATIERDGLSIDMGANLLLENFERTRVLGEEVGLGAAWHELVVAGSGGVLRDDELASFAPERAFDVLRFRGLSWPTRIRLLAFLKSARRSRGDLDFFDLSAGEDEREGIDADSFLRAEYGDELVDWLADPFVRTFHFHGADRLSMKYFDALAALLVHRGGFVPHAFAGGMASLPEALASRLPITTSVEVRAIVRDGEALRIDFEDGSERCDAVVLATPAPAVRRTLGDVFSQQRSLADAIRYSSTVMCAYRVPRAVARDFEGIWVPLSESAIVCCCANEMCKGAGDANDCVFVLGTHHEAAVELADWSDGEILSAIAREWARLFPEYRGAMRGLAVRRWVEALPVYAPGVVRRVARFWEEGQGAGGVWLCGDYLNHPWIEGAIRCGEKVASRIGPA